MKTNILGINCSPRDNSNSEALLQHSFNSLHEKYGSSVETDIISLCDYTITPCLACSVCGKTKDTDEFIPCITDDDMVKISKKLLWAHGIAISTPVYFGLATHLFSNFIMRTRFLRHQDFALANKIVGIMTTAGRRSGGGETTITSTWLPFIRHGCLIVGNGDKTSQFGTVAWAGAAGDVIKDDWGLIQAQDTAERIYDMAKLIEAGKDKLNYKSNMTFSYKSGT